jgi:RimJ/RimL family protein N-acetyltransferase
MANGYSVTELSLQPEKEVLTAFYDFHKRLLATAGKEPKTEQAHNARQLELLAIPRRHECILQRDGIVIGRLEVSAYKTSSSQNALQVAGELLEPISDESLYAEVMNLIEKWASIYNTTHAFIKTTKPWHKPLAHFLKGEAFNEQLYMDLLTKNINRSLLEQWKAEANLDGLREEIITSVPTEYLDSVVAIWNRGLRDIPNHQPEFTPYFTVEEELIKTEERLKANTLRPTFMLMNAANDICGFSNITIWQNNKTAAQALTWVAPELRNRGLGKYIKARMTMEVADKYPDIEKIATDCFVHNLPMRHINELAGFEYTYTGYHYRVTF